ncbi:MAG: phosphatidate cytidylyltransferase [Thermodesulfobacteriota bacterium]
MNNQLQRVLTAIIGIPILYIIFYLGGLWFLAFFLIVVFLAQLEFAKILQIKGYSVERAITILFSLVLIIAAYFGYFYLTLSFTSIIIATFVLQLSKQDLQNAFMRAGSTLFGITYIGWFLSHAILLRNIDRNSNINSVTESLQGVLDVGFFYVIFVVACTFLNDAGAYYVGNWKGKRKLLPRVSPGKTVEGTLGGIITAIISAGVVNLIFKSPIPFPWPFLLGFIVAIAAILGDLVESMIKRSVGLKDSGNIVPGHGGVLDRFDSLIFVFPVSYYSIIIY